MDARLSFEAAATQHARPGPALTTRACAVWCTGRSPRGWWSDCAGDQRLAERLLDAPPGPGAHGPDRGLRPPPDRSTVIAEMLGVPAATVTVSTAGRTPWWGPPPRAGACCWPSRPSGAYLRYLRKAIRRTRGPSPGTTCSSALVQAEEAGDRLSEDELLAMASCCLIAGHETTVNLIGNGTLALLQHPEQTERLRGDPALMPPRWRSCCATPARWRLATERYAREDVTVAGVTIPAGDLVLAVARLRQPGRRPVPRPGRAGPGPRAEPAPGLRAGDRTSAWGRPSPDWRGGSPSRRCCAAGPNCAWRCRRPACAGAAGSSCGACGRSPSAAKGVSPRGVWGLKSEAEGLPRRKRFSQPLVGAVIGRAGRGRARPGPRGAPGR